MQDNKTLFTSPAIGYDAKMHTIPNENKLAPLGRRGIALTRRS